MAADLPTDTQPFALDPFFVDDGYTPDCRESAPPAGNVNSCNEPWYYDELMPHRIDFTTDAGTESICFNVVSQMALDEQPVCANRQWIVGQVAIPSTFTQQFGGGFRVVPDGTSNDDALNIPLTQFASTSTYYDSMFGYDSFDIVTFWAYADGFNQRPAEVHVDLYGQIVATFAMNPDLTGCDEANSGGGAQVDTLSLIHI